MLPTHRDGITYLEHCRITATDGRLCYSRDADAVIKYWGIPQAATACLLLGPGTSLTQQAARLLASENVMVGFVGGDGAPLYLASQSEYRPTAYLQDWCSFWYDPSARVAVGRYLLNCRADFVSLVLPRLTLGGPEIEEATQTLRQGLQQASAIPELLGHEAVFAKRLYAHIAAAYGTSFRRQPRGPDRANRFLDQGNYLAYGLAAAALWVLGIPHGMAVLHGATRRGALVFDVADTIKDGCILPAAFASAAAGDDDRGNRARCMAALDQFRAFPALFEFIKGAIDVGCGRRPEHGKGSDPGAAGTI